MPERRISIRTERLFPFQFLVLGGVFLFAGLVTLVIKPFISPVLLLLGGLILTGFRGVEFDTNQQQYREFNSLLLIRFGKWNPYSKVEKIYVNAVNTSQYVYTKVTTGTTFRNREYNAYIKFDNGTKVHLMVRKNKEKLMKQLKPVADLFSIPLTDNTAPNN